MADTLQSNRGVLMVWLRMSNGYSSDAFAIGQRNSTVEAADCRDRLIIYFYGPGVVNWQMARIHKRHAALIYLLTTSVYRIQALGALLLDCIARPLVMHPSCEMLMR